MNVNHEWRMQMKGMHANVCDKNSNFFHSGGKGEGVWHKTIWISFFIPHVISWMVTKWDVKDIGILENICSIRGMFKTEHYVLLMSIYVVLSIYFIAVEHCWEFILLLLNIIFCWCYRTCFIITVELTILVEREHAYTLLVVRHIADIVGVARWVILVK